LTSGQPPQRALWCRVLPNVSDPNSTTSLERRLCHGRQQRAPPTSGLEALCSTIYKRRCGGQEILAKVKAVAAVVVVLSVVASTAVIHGLGPKKRKRIHEPWRLDWEEHRVDLERRGMFRRMYRMDEQTFNNKLSELLRPILTRNDYYANSIETAAVSSAWCTPQVPGWSLAALRRS
ncbi:unnamed protein product, partial [Pylaiella littoralis]